MYRDSGYATLIAALIAALTFTACRDTPAPTVTIYAAASVADAVERLPETDGLRLRVVSAASSALARQIRAGAPADLFLSASVDWVRWLEAHTDKKTLARDTNRQEGAGTRKQKQAQDPPAFRTPQRQTRR